MSEQTWAAPARDLPPSGIVATADRSARFLAWSVDGVIGGAAMVFLGCVTAAIALLVQAAGGAEITATSPIVMLAAVVGFLAVTGVQWWLLVRDGQTLGKRWMGIRIVDRHGNPPGFLRVLVIRTWTFGFVQSFLGLLWYPLLFVDGAMMFLADRRCLHDHLAGTWVIDDEAALLAPRGHESS